MAPVHGACLPRFERAKEAFTENLKNGDDLGGAFAVTHQGELVVDLYGGWQDRKRETEWARDTIVCIYSSGKAVVSLLVAMAAEEGLIDYEATVASYWPEFAAAGKEAITVAQLLSHQAGLCGFHEEMNASDWLDWDLITARLAAMAPLWPPGSVSGYHPQTFGHLAGELLRRVTGKTVGTLIRDRFAAPHAISVFCGMTASEQARASHMTKPSAPPDLGELNNYTRAAFLTRWASPAGVDRTDWAAAELPASNMHADAAALARLMGAIAMKGDFEGVQLFSEQTFEALSRERIRGDDLVLPFTLSWAAGLMRNSNAVYGPQPETLGHSGFGGSCVLADPVSGVSIAYVMNKMSPYLVGDPRPMKLIEAVYSSL